MQEYACDKPGCTHTGEDALNCDAWLRGQGSRDDLSATCLTDGETLYYFYTTGYGYAEDGGTVICRPLQGTGRRPVCSGFQGDLALDRSRTRWFTDGSGLYGLLVGDSWDEAGQRTSVTTLKRIPLEAGTPAQAEEIFRWEQPAVPDVAVGGLFYAGISEGTLLLWEQIPPAAHTGSLSGDFQASTCRLRPLGSDGTLGEPLLEEPGGSPMMPQVLRDGTILRFVTEADGSAAMQRLDGQTGAVQARWENLLPAGVALRAAAGPWGGVLLLDGCGEDGTPHRCQIDLETGAVREREDALWFRSGSPTPQLPWIMADTGRYLVLAVGSRAATVTDLGRDGTAYTHPSDNTQYAVIEAADYLAGSTAWTLCTLLPGVEVVASIYLDS